MCLNHIHLQNASSSFPFFSPFPLPPSRLPLPVAPSPSSPPHCPLPVSSLLSQSCLPLPTPLLLVHPPASPFPSHSWPLPALLHLTLLLPISPSQSLPSPHPSLPLPIAPPRLHAPLLPVHPPLDHYLLLNQDMLQLLLSFCSFAHLRWCLRPMPPSPHSSSDDFTSILQISAR